MAEEKRGHLDKEAVLLLNRGRRGLRHLVFGRTAVIIALLAAQAGLLAAGFLRLGEYLVYGGSLLLSLVMALVVINRPGNPAKKITWIFLIMLVPVFAIPFYIYVVREIGHRLVRRRLEEIGQLIGGRAEVSEVIFISDEEAWKDFTRDHFGEAFDTSAAYMDNPLEGDNSYEVYLSDVSLQGALVTWLESIPEVRKINYSALTADMLSGANLLIAYVSLGIIVILLAVSIFLISNTVAIGISVRAEEINIMKYVGATDFFVRAPFVLEGMLIGLLGAALPLWMLFGLYNYVLRLIVESFSILSGFLDFLPVEELFAVLTPLCLMVGVGIGFLGSVTTVKKHLQV